MKNGLRAYIVALVIAGGTLAVLTGVAAQQAAPQPAADKPAAAQDTPPQTSPDALPEDAPPIDPDGKLPEPARADIVEAERFVKGLLKDDQPAGDPQQAGKFATRLLDIAQNGDDEPPVRYVLFGRAATMAATAGNVRLARRALDKFDQAFEGDHLALRFDTLSQLGKKVKSKADHKALADALIASLALAIQAGNYERVDRAMLDLGRSVQRSGSKKRQATFTAAQRVLRATRRQHQQTRQAETTLQTRPDDAAANQFAGQYHCLARGDWERGLPLLAKGTGPAADAARAELEQADNTTALVKVADAWVSAGDRMGGFAQLQAYAHAGDLFDRVESSATGLNQKVATSRLAQLQEKMDKDPAAALLVGRITSKWTVLFRAADPALWNTAVSKGENEMAISLADAPESVKFLRLSIADTDKQVILAITRLQLAQNLDLGTYGWNGSKADYSDGLHLGIFHDEIRGGRGMVETKYGRPGWGFGHVHSGKGQAWGWGGKVLPRTVFEIAVTAADLSEDEQEYLLK